MPVLWQLMGLAERAGLAKRTSKETAHQLRLLLDLHQERIVAVDSRQVYIRHVAVAAAQRADDFKRLVAGIQPVRRKADHQKTGGNVFKYRGQRSMLRQVVTIHRARDVDIRVRVEAVD